MKTAHATPELLAGYAQGTLTRGMALLVASHLTYCPRAATRCHGWRRSAACSCAIPRFPT
jgi:anti-sigma factor ChrR (cupin superfamily)